MEICEKYERNILMEKSKPVRKHGLTDYKQNKIETILLSFPFKCNSFSRRNNLIIAIT